MLKELNRKELIETNVEIIKDIHNFCIKHDIQYSLGYGTLLGAVRHKGMIPWDDDVDLIMPRPSYNKFISCYTSSKYTMQSCYKNRYKLPFLRISDETTFKEEKTSNCQNTGIAVDIYPIDCKEQSNLFLITISCIKAIIRIKSTIPIKKERGFLKNMIMLLLKLLTCMFDLNWLCRIFDRIVQIKPYSYSNFVGSYMSPYGDRDRFPKSIFEEYVYLIFEKEKFVAIKDYDIMLTNLYGDYMTPPNLKDRKSEHDAKFYKLVNLVI